MSFMFFGRGSATAQRRSVMLHYHFFKNAGTTIESILQDNFGDRFAHFDAGDHNSVIPNDDLIRFLDSHPVITAVSSHHLRPPKPANDRYSFYDILFLRHPIARLWSTYEFYLRMDEGKDPLSAAAKRSSAADFFRLLMEEYPQHATNAQVGLIASAGRSIPLQSDLASAVEVVLKATVLGTAEHFDESAVAAEHLLASVLRWIDFSYVPQNVSSGLNSLETQVQRMVQKCGKEILDALVEKNQLDVALHEKATEEVLRRLTLVPGWSKRLERLRDKCQKKSEGAATIAIASNHPHDFARHASELLL